MRCWITLLCAAAAASTALGSAADTPPADDDSAALSLTSPAAGPVVGRSVSLISEAALADAGHGEDDQRVSLDFRYDGNFTPAWRAVFADRLDLDWFGSRRQGQQNNTLKESYVSWQPSSGLLLDAGRINARQGVAFGYNPTDFFRANALRVVDSLDPNSLRDERLGTVMLRTETLWDGGALTALAAPRLADSSAAAAQAGPFSADWTATNGKNRWLLSVSERITGGLTPQWLVFGTEGAAPQVGMNLTTLIGGATVAYAEASGGRLPSLWAQAQGLPGSESLRVRAATGFTYNAANKVSLTVEYEYDGAAASRNAWEELRRGSRSAYGRYRSFVAAQQELPTQQSAFLYASWQDALVRHLDMAAFMRIDLFDRSSLPWIELRYHWLHVDAALRWQDYLGAASTDFGASPSGSTWQILLDYYL